MGNLARELRELGYERTEKESPFDEDGELWTNSYEFVCDKTATVIRKDASDRAANGTEASVYRYRNSDRVKLIGGHVSNYDWGETDGIFTYDN